MYSKTTFAILGIMFAIGCGGAAVPVAEVADSQATIRAAEEAGAERNPQASLHLKLARDQLAKARELIQEGEEERASLYLNQAQADAELALALAHKMREQRAVQTAQERINEISGPTQGQPMQ